MPTFMRNGLTSLISTIAAQFTSLYSDFQFWQIDIRLQAAMTCQVMYLETILNYRLLGSFIRTIYISDGDGVIVDFIVNVPAGLNIDNYRMIALLEKYKIAGKRYIIGQSAYIYDVEWTNFRCELADREYTIQWSNFRCELTDREFTVQWSDFYCESHPAIIDNQIQLNSTVGQDGTTYTITSDYPVTSDVSVDVQVDYWNGEDSQRVPLSLLKGETTKFGILSRTDSLGCYIADIIPTSDSTYNYIQ